VSSRRSSGSSVIRPHSSRSTGKEERTPLGSIQSLRGQTMLGLLLLRRGDGGHIDVQVARLLLPKNRLPGHPDGHTSVRIAHVCAIEVVGAGHHAVVVAAIGVEVVQWLRLLLAGIAAVHEMATLVQLTRPVPVVAPLILAGTQRATGCTMARC